MCTLFGFWGRRARLSGGGRGKGIGGRVIAIGKLRVERGRHCKCPWGGGYNWRNGCVVPGNVGSSLRGHSIAVRRIVVGKRNGDGSFAGFDC